MGFRPRPRWDFTIDNLAGDALAPLDHLGMARVGVAGCSIGSMIVQAPKRVSRLFPSNTAVKVGTKAFWAKRIATGLEQGLRSFAPQIMARWFATSFRESDTALPWLTALSHGDEAGYGGTCRPWPAPI